MDRKFSIFFAAMAVLNLAFAAVWGLGSVVATGSQATELGTMAGGFLALAIVALLFATIAYSQVNEEEE